MAVYILAVINKKDDDLYAEYEKLANRSAMEFGVEPVVVDDNPKLLEGHLPGQRVVLLKFPSEEVVKTWYDSAIYKRAREVRAKAAETPFLLMVRGVTQDAK